LIHLIVLVWTARYNLCLHHGLVTRYLTRYRVSADGDVKKKCREITVLIHLVNII